MLVLVLVLLLRLSMLLGRSGDVGILFEKDADNASGNFIDNSLVVFTNILIQNFLDGQSVRD
jgi:hypothetical protein